MEDKHCSQCDEKMDEVFNAGEGFKFKGWYCVRCHTFDRAIGREVKKQLDDKYGHKTGIVR